MRKKNDKIGNQIVIYQGPTGALELKADAVKETIWATQSQIANVFNVERSVITKHIGNILKNGEVDPKSNVQKMHIAKSDKPVALFVWFLRRAGILDTRRLTPQALTALTLLIAESHPKDKEKMTGLVAMLLRK